MNKIFFLMCWNFGCFILKKLFLDLSFSIFLSRSFSIVIIKRHVSLMKFHNHLKNHFSTVDLVEFFQKNYVII